MNKEVLVDPVKGLLPYMTSDSDFFVTDKIQAEAFFRQLNKSKFVILSGNTGAGKTSFVNCIFDKKHREYSNVDDQWNIVKIRPGLNPVKSIPFFLSNSNFSADKLSNGFVEEMTELLMSDSNGLFELFEKYKIKEGAKLLMVIDPLDDLFLLSRVMKTEDSLTAEHYIDTFINLLCTFERYCKELPVYIVISFSNNFPENVGRYPKFLDLIERNKFLFKGMEIENVHVLMDEIVPENVKKENDYESLKERIKHDLKQEFSNVIEWLFFFQHALKRTLTQWNTNKKDGLLKCYNDIGGVRESLVRHAELIYKESVASTEKKFESLYELVFRSMLDSHGQFVATSYKDVVEVSTRIDPAQKKYLEEKYINPFLQRMAEQELGFFEVIPSVEGSDRAASFMDKVSLTGSDVISVRNKCLITRWHILERFQNARVKLIYEYEWYSRMAHEHKETGKDNFPTTIQAYALANNNRDKSKDPEEFKVIDELFSITEAWEKSYFDKSRKGFAGVEETKKYLQKAINYWVEKASAEEKERAKKERAKSRRVMVISIFIVAFFIISFPIYRVMLKNFDNMKAEYDCLVLENNRIISFVDSMQIAKLREYAQRNQVSPTVIDTLKSHANILVSQLKANGHKVYQESIDLYILSEWDFMMNRSEWDKRSDETIDRCATLHKQVLESANADTCLLTIDSVATPYETWTKYKEVQTISAEDYAKLQYARYLEITEVECRSDTQGIKVPPNSTYYLKCNICK